VDPPRLHRALSTFARTLYRELRRADYSPPDVLRLVNEIVELVTAEARGGAAPGPPPAIDRETGLPNAAVMREVLEFELAHAHAHAGHDLLVVALDVELPHVAADAEVTAVHEALSRELRRLVRASETVGRVAPARYLVVLPRATLDTARPLLRRLGAAFARLEALDRASRVRVVGRAAVADAAITSPAELLARCAAAPATPVYPPPIATHSGPLPVVGDRRVVLALGGGAARAMAHLGVLRVLRRAGVTVAGVAGTSVGGVIGAMIAAGHDVELLVDRFVGFAASPLYRRMRATFSRQLPRIRAARNKERFFHGSSLAFLSDSDTSVLDDGLLAEFVAHFVGDDRLIQSLKLPFAACAADLVSGRAITLSYGSLHAALRASCAIPGMFAPQVDGDRLLVDGAVVSEVPIAAAQQLGVAAPIMAAHLERAMRPVTGFASATEIAVRASALLETQLVREQLRAAPLVLPLAVADVGWLSFRDGKALIAEGERAAEAALPPLLDKLDGKRSTAPVG
jgi:NTE family protein